MIKPNKDIFLQYSLLGVGAYILKKINYQISVSALWNKVKDKKEIASLFLSMMESIIPGYSDNKYYKNNFDGSEINDQISYNMCSKYIKKNGIYTQYNGETPYELFDEYDAKIILKSRKKVKENHQTVI